MKRGIFVTVVLAILGFTSYFVAIHQVQTPQGFSLETFYRYLGQPVKTLDRSITRVIGVNAQDERELGDYLSSNIENLQVSGMIEQKVYVNNIIDQLSKQYNPKNLHFRVFIMSGPANAFALPGGIIVITTGMLDLLKSEAQLVAVLSHEKGHIDLGHCIDYMRVQAKTYRSQFGAFFDWYLNMMLRHSFSKFQENEADRFGFESLLALKYDPSSMAEAFTLMSNHYQQNQQKMPHLIGDYLSTHPSLILRAENWDEKAKRWKMQHPQIPYYVGVENYQIKKARSEYGYDFTKEWHKSNNK